MIVGHVEDLLPASEGQSVTLNAEERESIGELDVEAVSGQRHDLFIHDNGFRLSGDELVENANWLGCGWEGLHGYDSERRSRSQRLRWCYHLKARGKRMVNVRHTIAGPPSCEMIRSVYIYIWLVLAHSALVAEQWAVSNKVIFLDQ